MEVIANQGHTYPIGAQKLPLNDLNGTSRTSQNDTPLLKHKDEESNYSDTHDIKLYKISPQKIVINQSEYSYSKDNIRKDVFGNEIIKARKNKKHKISFVDTIKEKQELVSVITVENYKEYNDPDYIFQGEETETKNKDSSKSYIRKAKQGGVDCDCCKSQ